MSSFISVNFIDLWLNYIVVLFLFYEARNPLGEAVSKSLLQILILLSGANLQISNGILKTTKLSSNHKKREASFPLTSSKKKSNLLFSLWNRLR